MTNRRDILVGAAGILGGALPVAALAQVGVTPLARGGGGEAFPYDYLLLEVKQGTGRGAGQAAFLAYLTSTGVSAVAAAGGEVIGYFTPLIGWSSEQLAVLVRWPGSSAGRERALATLLDHPSVAKVERSAMAATTRPGPTDRPETTGIYTHRWFTIKTTDFDEFVALSAGAWPDFEREFPTKVYGLFRAQTTPDETRGGLTRMLLNTWYQSHAVWDASRTPSAGPAGRFDRRGQITLTTRVVSLRYTPIQPAPARS